MIEKRFTKTAAPVICRGTTPVVERFEVVNDTGQPVVVKGIERSCGCLDAKLDKQRLEPGESAELTMRVEMTPRGERRTVSCSVVTDNAGYWRFELAVAGYPLLQFPQDIEHLNAGEVQPGGELVNKATLYTYSLAPQEPPEIASSSAEAAGARIGFKNGEPEAAAEGVMRRPILVTLRIPPERLSGRFTKGAAFKLSGAGVETASSERREGSDPRSGTLVDIAWNYSWATRSHYVVNPKRVVLRDGTDLVTATAAQTCSIRRAEGGRLPEILKLVLQRLID